MNTEHSDHESNETETPIGEDELPASVRDTGPDPMDAAERAGEPSRPPRTGRFLAFLAFLISLAALAGAGWLWWQDRNAADDGQAGLLTEIARLDSGDARLRSRVEELGDRLDSLASGDGAAEMRALQQRMEAEQEQLAQLDQAVRDQLALSRSLQTATDAIQDRLQAAEAAISGISTRELDAGGQLDLAEVDYLLRLANERLKLFADPAAADAALEVADLHLAALDNPVYTGVRQEIAAARRALAAVDMPDYLELADRLDRVQEAISGLHFQDEQAAEVTAADAPEEGWWAKVKSVFNGLVTVRRATGSEGRLSIEDKDYIRQRIWLQVEIAHLALMRRDEASFRKALDRVDDSLSSWFNADAGTFDTISNEIDALSKINIEPDMPDITGPWSTLRLLRGGRPGPGATPVEPAPPVGEDTQG